MTSKYFYQNVWFVDEYILTFASHIQLSLYMYFYFVNLLGSSPVTALRTKNGPVNHESCINDLKNI